MLLQCSCGLECPDLKSKLPRYLALLSFQGFFAAFTFRELQLKLTSPCAIKQKHLREKARHEQAPDLSELYQTVLRSMIPHSCTSKLDFSSDLRIMVRFRNIFFGLMRLN